MTDVVVAKQLKVGYKNRTVLRSFDVRIGTGLTALLGPNGAGKTTLLHLVCGLLRPSAGSLMVLGTDMAQRTARRELSSRLGFLPQNLGYLPSFTAEDLVAYAAWLKKVPARRTATLVAEALSSVGLSDRAESPLKTLSGGMVRRAGIAAAMVHQPELLLLDEPSAGLDPEQQVHLRDLLTDISSRTSVVLSTHLLADVRSVCQRVIVINEGSVRFAGPVSSLERTGLPASVIGSAPGALEQGYLDVLAAGVKDGVS